VRMLICIMVGMLLCPAAGAQQSARPANYLDEAKQANKKVEHPYVVVLGIAQDAGFPQAGCRKACCRDRDFGKVEGASCLGIIDPISNQRWLVECTPHFPAQLRLFDKLLAVEKSPGLDGIFLTHAHIGHYSGLIHLGREVMGADHIPVYCMPRMKQFLRTNGPWSQLVTLENIVLHELAADQAVQLNERIKVTPILVPHRDEFSETVGFIVEGPNHSVLFLPDIDKWERWEKKVEDYIAKVDTAFLDATFFQDGELPGRDMSQIPHPFVSESIHRFAHLDETERRKVAFIHLNHTNPAHDATSTESRMVERAGMSIARTGQRFGL
jgi:pyrroloquinoline quinone biosynthesis protein B